MSYFRIRKAITTAILVADGVFTSDTIHMNQYDRLTGIVYSDQTGTLLVEQSIDGENWDFETSISLTGGTSEEIDVKVYGEYARLVYTNGDTDQTEFRLAVYATPMG